MQNATQLQKQQQNARDNKEMSEVEGEKRRKGEAQKKNANAKMQRKKMQECVCVSVCVGGWQIFYIDRQLPCSLSSLLLPTPSPYYLYLHPLSSAPFHFHLHFHFALCICISNAFAACTFRLLAFCGGSAREMRATKDETKCKTHMRIIEFYYIVWRGTHTLAHMQQQRCLPNLRLCLCE